MSDLLTDLRVRAAKGKCPMNTSEPKPIKLSREFARKGEKWHIGVEDRHSASWDGDHYDLKWRSFDTDAELLGHLQQVFKRMEDDGWS